MKNKGNKSVTITWDKIDNYDDIKYEVCYGDSPGSYAKVTTASNVYKDIHIKLGEKHYYWVRGVYIYDKETIGGEFSEIISASPSLSQVTGLNAKGLNAAKIQVEWKDEDNEDVFYQVYRSVKKTGFKKVETTDKKIFSQLVLPSESNVKYYYKVRAIFKDNMGKWHFGKFSEVDYAYPRVWVPTNFRAWALGKHTAKCSWDKVGQSSIKYLVYRGNQPTGDWGNAIAVTKKTHFINKHLKSAHKYYYMVRAMQIVNGKRYYSSYSKKDYAYPR